MKTWARTTETELPLFDAALSEQLKDKGKRQAAENKASLLRFARELAVKIAKERGEISADDVALELHKRGISIFALGNASGSLFKTKDWVWTGSFKKSERVHAHSNLIRVWRYVGK